MILNMFKEYILHYISNKYEKSNQKIHKSPKLIVSI